MSFDKDDLGIEKEIYAATKQICDLYNYPSILLPMSILQYASNGLYSQQGEQGIIDEALKRIGIKYGISVEFGAPTREYCSNTFHLDALGWICYFFDDNPSDPFVIKERITKENINLIPALQNCRVLSMDTDGPDAELWREYQGKPDIVIIEINSSLNPDVDYYSPDRGASFAHMNKLAAEKGYFLLCHTGNCIYVLDKYRELFPDADGTFNRRWLAQ